jgi:hypothetical protein
LMVAAFFLSLDFLLAFGFGMALDDVLFHSFENYFKRLTGGNGGR